jgi:Flp pilus assembly protein TadG
MLTIHSRRRPLRRGAVVPLVAFCLIVMFTYVALVVDGGGLRELRRRAQAAADAAALSAADEIFRNYTQNQGVDPDGSAVNRALANAAANGFSNDGSRSLVTVRVSPQNYASGARAGTPIPKGRAEVTVRYNQPRYFSTLLGTGTIPVTARAVSRGKWAPAFVGIHVLDLHAPSALRGTGGALANVTGGAAVIVNSDAATAAVTTGGSTLAASRFEITGGTSGGGFIGDVRLGTPPQPDPLRHIPEPAMSGLSDQSNGPKHYSNGNRTIAPGVYHGGISITGQANVTMQPGIYYMDGGGFSMTGQGNLLANGVMIFNAPKQPSDAINISGSNGGSVTMTPPDSGTYKGLTLFQQRSAGHTMTISGNGSFFVTGTFYAPGGLLTVTGNGGGSIGSQYISLLLDINGGGGLLIDYHPDQVIPRRILGLVE